MDQHLSIRPVSVAIKEATRSYQVDRPCLGCYRRVGLRITRAVKSGVGRWKKGRIECPYILPSGSPTPYKQYVLTDDTEMRTCTLQYDAVTDEFYYHIGTRAYDPDSDDEANTTDTADTEHQAVLSVDLGVHKSKALVG